MRKRHLWAVNGALFLISVLSGNWYFQAPSPDEQLMSSVYVPHYSSEQRPEATATPTATPTPTTIPAATPTQTTLGSAYDVIVSSPEYAACLASPERYEWRKWAAYVGFPTWSLEELAYVIENESGGDLCAVNTSSGATCWIQQVVGAAYYLDPIHCMSAGYAKWIDGGQSFERHWYHFWVGSE